LVFFVAIVLQATDWFSSCQRVMLNHEAFIPSSRWRGSFQNFCHSFGICLPNQFLYFLATQTMPHFTKSMLLRKFLSHTRPQERFWTWSLAVYINIIIHLSSNCVEWHSIRSLHLSYRHTSIPVQRLWLSPSLCLHNFCPSKIGKLMKNNSEKMFNMPVNQVLK
jgi:hypothetical protein